MAAGRDVHLDWFHLPDKVMKVLRREFPGDFQGAAHVGARLYVSSARDGNPRFLAWLRDLSRCKGVMVIRKERGGERPFSVKCRACGRVLAACPSCGAAFLKARDSQTDVSLAVDMLSMAHRGAFTTGVLMSDDKDFAPALEEAARLGRRMISFQWGEGLSPHCWASINVPRVARLLSRNGAGM